MAGVAFIVARARSSCPTTTSRSSYVFTETVNATGFGGDDRTFASSSSCYVFRPGLLMAQYTITGFDASAHMAEETHQASRIGGGRHVHVGGRVGGLRLHPARRGDVRRSRAPTAPSTTSASSSRGSGRESMGQNWAEALLFICVVAQFFCVTASMTSASRMMFAFSRDGAVPGHRLWRQVARNRVPGYSVIAIGVLSAAIYDPGLLELPRRLPRGDRDRGDRALHRVHPARDPAIPARHAVRARRLDARQALQVDRCDRDPLGRLHRDHLPACRPTRSSVPWTDELHVGALRTTRPSSWVGAVAAVRRLVAAVGQASGSRARSRWAPRRSSSGWRRRRSATSTSPPRVEPA